MKNTIKNIAAFAALSVAALASGLTVSAQNLDDGTYKVENGIAYAKRAIINNDGTYTIDLETFVTGEVTQTFESVPVDVVLVLDVSGSMADSINEYVYTARNHTNITGGNGGWNNNQKNINPVSFIQYNNEYYQVYIGRGGSQYNRHYFLFFTVNGVRHFINSSGNIVTEEPTNITSNNTNLWPNNITLYTRSAQSTGVTKIAALKTAVEAFIEQIQHNDLYEDDTNDKPRSEPLGNRVAIVKFAMDSYYNSNAGATSDNAPLSEGDHNQGGNNQYNYTEVVKNFSVTSRQTSVDSLTNAVNGLHAAGATAADYGMNLARLLIQGIGSDRANSNKTVVFFTDGEPNHQSGFNNTVATTAISNSKIIKDITYGTGSDATHPAVFSVGLFATTPEDGDLKNYMNYISSNYPNATAYNNGGTQASNKYYMDASGGSADELKAIFTAIAHAAGGSGNTQVSGGSSVTVDIVSSSFSVPKGFDENPGSAITVLVAPCTGVTTIKGKQYLTFGEAKAPGEYGLTAITPSISEADNKVSTTGFDYSANWCGPDPTSTSQLQPGYHGFKQIIQFVITVKDDAVGGPAVETNDSDSGIYLEGATEPLVKFNRPTVKLPVQIWIQKNGLQGDDSAVFTLARAPFTENFDPEKAKWENITKIVVGPEDLTADGLYIKKQVGLDPDYYYRIKEDAWAFGYQYQYGGVLYTVGDEVVNPFVFTNTPKNKKFDEATARNIFTEKVATTPTEPETPDTPSEKAKK